LKLMHLVRIDMCAYQLVCPETQLPMKKDTGLLVSHEHMATQLKRLCPGHEKHTPIAGSTETGKLSEFAGRYTSAFVEAVLSTVPMFQPQEVCEVLLSFPEEFSTTSCDVTVQHEQLIVDFIMECDALEEFVEVLPVEA
jgi:hypothetical protein